MINILITGADGFIAKNLKERLGQVDCKIASYSRKSTYSFLNKSLINADIIFHLAGVNKSENSQDFTNGNINLAKYITGFIEKNKKKPRIIYSSSTQATLKNDYGVSKLKAENIFKLYSQRTGNQVFIFRLNGIFGKWSKPDYNSVVSTFCYRIIRSKPINIDGPSKPLKLTYIDDLMDDFIKILHTKIKKKFVFRSPSKSHSIEVKQIATIIESFHTGRKLLLSEDIGVGLKRKLYATYLSYLPANGFIYNLPKKEDARGKFVEILKNKKNGQLSFITINPKNNRGNHYHNTKSEKFIVVKGSVTFRFVNIVSLEEKVFVMSDELPQVIESIPGWNHELINETNQEAIVVIWANEIFEADKHDTFQMT